MNSPPMLLHLKFPADRGSWGLWLPLFLVYPVILAFMLLLSPLVLLATLILWPFGKSRGVLLSGIYIWMLIFKLRGLSIDVEQQNRNTLINFV